NVLNAAGAKVWDTSFKAIRTAVSQKQRSTTTGRDGRFQLERMPRDCRTILTVKHPGFAEVQVDATTTPEPDDIDLTLVKPRTIPVQVVADVAGEPVAGIIVDLYSSGKVRLSAGGTTDAAGKVGLRMPPGEYSLNTRSRVKDYVAFSGQLTVAPEPQEQPPYTI